jgi:hypothetical protein
MHPIKKSLFFLFLFSALTGYSQTLYRGIVVDSAAVTALPGVHVKIKNSSRGVITNKNGVFVIEARSTDTLLFTSVAYKTLELPLLFEETALFIRLSEQVNILKEITIKATRLEASNIVRSQRTLPRPMSKAEGVFSPIDYFSKWQKEKRKLYKLIKENDRTFTYLQVVSDQEVRETLMEEFSLTENQYYELLAKFNQQSATIQYSTNPDEIVKSLKEFLKKRMK